ncbi:MAG: gliding motility-associated C-terminal domain-containing protein [Bacteroidia bacterium]|nr:gliding motility-associated C-terminal domain-containing protein [Bacteroidia bacterium]
MLRLPFFTLIILFVLRTSATHVVGGEINYKHTTADNYQVQLDLFIDCLNGNPGAIADDEYALFYVFTANDNQLIAGAPFKVKRAAPNRLVKLNYNCILNAPNACVDHYVYLTQLNLPAGKGGYIISFQRCCRNNSISNLANPGAQGANYWTMIPDPNSTPNELPNSSAFFNELPPNFLCTNAKLVFNHSATDPDGDSLVYSLFHPFMGANNSHPRPDNGINGKPDFPPFPLINWQTPYDEFNPIAGSPPLAIDPVTGRLTLTPNQTGQFVVGIVVKEYRNGKLISETKRDYQFNVSECNLTLLPGTASDQRICNDKKVLFANNSIGATRYSWDFGVAGVLDDTSNLRYPDYEYATPGIYKVKLKVFRSNCSDSVISELRLGTKARGQADIQKEQCALTVKMEGSSNAICQWYFDGNPLSGNPVSIKTTPNVHLAKVVYVDTVAGCNDSFEQAVDLEVIDEELKLANVFTPGDDGFNDCFKVYGLDASCTEWELKVFNRWGEKVWETSDVKDCWNGKVNNTGAAVPEGHYFYVLVMQDKDHMMDKKVINGSITIIR